MFLYKNKQNFNTKSRNPLNPPWNKGETEPPLPSLVLAPFFKGGSGVSP